MTEEPVINEELLIRNSILAFLHNYREHQWVGKYQELLEQLENGQLKITKAQGRRRPAKRQRQAKASKDTAS